jgi:hypothetical protein
MRLVSQRTARAALSALPRGAEREAAEVRAAGGIEPPEALGLG